MVVSWSVYLKAEHESAVRFIESIEKYCPSPNIFKTIYIETFLKG